MPLVDLPEFPGPAQSQPYLIDFGSVRVPPLGGAVQRINRTGARYAIELTLPAMAPADARRWSAALTLGLRDGVRWRLRQVGLTIPPMGTVLVAGGSQLGLALDVDGGTAFAPWVAGQFVSVLTGGQRYLHQLASAGAFASGGTAELPLAEPLRVSPADNAPVEFVPQIEGLIEGEGGLPLAQITASRLASPMTIRITERG